MSDQASGSGGGSGGGKKKGRRGGSSSPAPPRPSRKDARRVAIIGGGVSGLACARALTQLGMEPVVYDTGNHAPGGRCSSRVLQLEDGREVLFDHSAQLVRVSDPQNEWGLLVEEMDKEGVLRRWEGVGTLSKGGGFKPLEAPVYCGNGGMRAVVNYLARNMNVERPKWVSKARLNRDASWRLWHYDQVLGDFDYFVIAHNGKCAARLMKSPGEIAAPVQKLLDVRFGSRLKFTPPRQMQLCSLWVLLAYFPTPLTPQPSFQGAFVEGVPELSWVGNNVPKLQQEGFASSGGAWTIVSSPQFGEAHKAPQEHTPLEKKEEVTRLLLSAFERAIGVPGGGGAQPLLRPTVTFCQLWGAANPISVATRPADQAFLFQGSTNVGVCGDWLLEPSLEGAALSGIQLAKHIHAVSQERKAGGSATGSPDVGLDCGFQAVGGKGAHPLGKVAAS